MSFRLNQLAASLVAGGALFSGPGLQAGPEIVFTNKSDAPLIVTLLEQEDLPEVGVLLVGPAVAKGQDLAEVPPLWPLTADWDLTLAPSETVRLKYDSEGAGEPYSLFKIWSPSMDAVMRCAFEQTVDGKEQKPRMRMVAADSPLGKLAGDGDHYTFSWDLRLSPMEPRPTSSGKPRSILKSRKQAPVRPPILRSVSSQPVLPVPADQPERSRSNTWSVAPQNRSGEALPQSFERVVSFHLEPEPERGADGQPPMTFERVVSWHPDPGSGQAPVVEPDSMELALSARWDTPEWESKVSEDKALARKVYHQNLVYAFEHAKDPMEHERVKAELYDEACRLGDEWMAELKNEREKAAQPRIVAPKAPIPGSVTPGKPAEATGCCVIL
jgi:hypothetical protein